MDLIFKKNKFTSSATTACTTNSDGNSQLLSTKLPQQSYISNQIPQGGTSGWLLRVAPQGGSSGWLLRVAPQGGSSGWLLRVAHQCGSPGWLLRVAPVYTRHIVKYKMHLKPLFQQYNIPPFKKLVFHRLVPQLYKYEVGIIPIALPSLFTKIALFINITHEIVIN